MPVHWQMDSASLKKRFLELTAQVHPDRFDANGPPQSHYALRWSIAVNRAYQTLRDPEERTRYFLKLQGLDTDLGHTPTDLAEEYFDVQEGPRSQLVEFRTRLEKVLAECESTSEQLSKYWPGPEGQKVLTDLHANFVRSRYIRSMLNDLEKKLETTPS